MTTKEIRRFVVLGLALILVTLLAFSATVHAEDATGVTAIPEVNVNVRTGPATAYQVIRTVPMGTQMTVFGQDITSAWLSVRLADGTEGWVARFLTNFTGIVTTLATPPLSPPAAVPIQPTTDVATILTADPSFLVNVRTGPATAYRVIRTVPSGTQMTVLGQDVTATWLSVQLGDGTQGWVARFLTDFTDSVATLATPALTQPPLAPPSAVPLQPAVTPNVNIRTGPATAFSVIRSVPPGTQLTVLGQDITGAWLSVQLSDGVQGWVARFLTEFTGTALTVEAPALTQPPLAPPATVEGAQTGVAALPTQPDTLDAAAAQQSLDSNWRSLGAGQTHWYAFQHQGDDLPVQIWMDSEPNEGASFQVFSAGDAQAIMSGRSPEEFANIGSGTPNPNEPGDLFWLGNFAEAGRFYVIVQNTGTRDVNYTIIGAGPGFGGLDSLP
ncbi:MAG TPA: SH3 domain-containing protein [Candidatus Tectomicrobia bacterium]